MHRDWIQLAQQIVKVEPSGFIGNDTHVAIDKYLRSKKVKDLDIAALPKVNAPEFTIGYKLIAVIQIHATFKGVPVGSIDGYPGPLTEYAINVLLKRDSKFSRPDTESEGFPAEKDLEKYYGKVGTNQVKAKIPFTLLLAWDLRTKITSFSCHEKVVKSIEGCYGRVLSHYGEEEIKRLRLDRFGGCLNIRMKRGGSTPSTHSWGIAIDTDSQQNKLRWDHTRATLAQPQYEEWWKIWEADGWLSLGRQKDFDWMHMQATKMKG